MKNGKQIINEAGLSSFLTSSAGILVSDIVILTILYFIPVFSHLLPIPLYLIEPMRIAALAAYLLSRNQLNAVLLALTIPIFSMLTSGHPPLYKAMLISFELAVNVALLHWLLGRYRMNSIFSVFISMFISKAMYYILKYVFIISGLISGRLISNDIFSQLLIAVGFSIIFGYLLNRSFKRQGE